MEERITLDVRLVRISIEDAEKLWNMQVTAFKELYDMEVLIGNWKLYWKKKETAVYMKRWDIVKQESIK